jgi:hypothetical protein
MKKKPELEVKREDGGQLKPIRQKKRVVTGGQAEKSVTLKHDDFDSIFDEILAQELVKLETQVERPQNKNSVIKAHTSSAAASRDTKKLASELEQAIDGLGALFGSKGKLL